MRTPWTLCSLFLAVPAFGCVLPGDEENETSSGDSPSDSSDGGPTGNPSSSADDDGSSSGGGSIDTGSDGSSSEGGSVDTTGGEPTTCTDATLLAGNPYFNGDLEGWNPDGQGLLADPPLRMRYLADAAGQLAIDTQQEVWLSDGTDLRRIAGDEEEFELQYQPSGACADVRVIISNGIAGLPNGNIVIADTVGGGLIELADPAGNCTASPIAGNQVGILDVDIDEGVAAPGDVDGPGAEALFFGIELPVADADGNIYVNDSGNTKIRRIANDADRTVTTLFDYGAPDEPFVLAMHPMNGTLYVTGANATEDIIWAIDAESGEATELFRGRGLFDEIDSSQQATMFAIEDDGADLFIASNKGYVFRVSTSGEPLGVVAGMGAIVDYPADLDLTMPFALDQLPLRTWGVGDGDLQRVGSDFVYTGNAGGVGFHLWSIHCGG